MAIYDVGSLGNSETNSLLYILKISGSRYTLFVRTLKYFHDQPKDIFSE